MTVKTFADLLVVPGVNFSLIRNFCFLMNNPKFVRLFKKWRRKK